MEVKEEVPSVESIKQIRQVEPFKGAIFGGRLSDMLQHQRVHYPNVKIPKPFAVICDCLLDSNPASEGVFRISPSSDKLHELKIMIESGSSSLPGSREPHAAASLLKGWFREMKEPIIPLSHYDEFISNADKADVLEGLVFNALPDDNRYCLLYLIRFLRIICAYKEITKMGENNVAMTFSPNLFKQPDPFVQAANTSKETKAIETLLLHLTLPDSIPGVYSDIKLPNK